MGIKSIYKADKETQEKVIVLYKNGVSMREIERQLFINRQTISKFLEEKNIKTIKGNHYKKYSCNENFFEIIDTEEKAYWLGFIFADGYIRNLFADSKTGKFYGQEQLGITISKKDLSHLKKFKEAIQAENPITFEIKKNLSGTTSELCRIIITSQKMVNDLINKGCHKNKSLTLEPPKNVPQNLIIHFIRGFFDGDGSIIKNSKNNTYGINFTSTFSIVSWLKSIFKVGSIVQDSRREKTWYYTFGGNIQVLNFCNELYKSANIFLERKHNRYLELFEKYSES